MNENDIQKIDADPCDTAECDPIPTEGTEAADDAMPSAEGDLANEAVADRESDGQASENDPQGLEADAPVDPEISTDPDPNSDSDPAAPLAAAPEEQLRQLRDELRELRAEMAQKDAILSRMGDECAEFHTLYPKTPLSSVPDDVWRDVKQGVPLAAAYALAERRRAYTEALADSTNKKNEKCSTGAVTPTENEYFTPGEVRAMSQSEVRANYQKIMRSMQKWS